MRTYDERIDVRCTPDEEPESFLWRGRLYVVHAVVDRWARARPWWRRALDPAAEAGAEVGAGAGSGVSDAVVTLLADLEEDLWRVEAAAGRVGRASSRPGFGVYDLVRTGVDEWRLLTVLD